MNRLEIENLFDDAFNDPELVRPSTEFDALLLRDFSEEQEAFTILFELADEAIQDPDAEKRYIEKIESKEGHLLPSSDVSEQLAKMQKVLMTPVMSLKRGGPRVTQQDGTALVTSADIQKKKVIPPHWKIRRKAELLDLAYQILLSLIVVISVTWFVEPTMRDDLLTPGSMELPEAVCIIGFLICTTLLMLVLYPFFSGVQSTAQKLFQLELLTQRGGKPSAAKLAQRSLLTPLSILAIPFRLKKPLLSDELCKLALSIVPKVEEPTLEP